VNEATALAHLLKIRVSARWMMRNVFWPMRDKFAAALTVDFKDHFAPLVQHATNALGTKDPAKLPGKPTGQGRILNKLDGIGGAVDGVAGTVGGMAGTVGGMAGQVNEIHQYLQLLASPDRGAPKSTEDSNKKND